MTEQAGSEAYAARQAEDPYGLALELRAQAAAIEASAPPQAGMVKVKVEPPAPWVDFAGTVIGAEFTPVHASKMPALRRAAAEVGVTLTEEG